VGVWKARTVAQERLRQQDAAALAQASREAEALEEGRRAGAARERALHEDVKSLQRQVRDLRCALDLAPDGAAAAAPGAAASAGAYSPSAAFEKGLQRSEQQGWRSTSGIAPQSWVTQPGWVGPSGWANTPGNAALFQRMMLMQQQQQQQQQQVQMAMQQQQQRMHMQQQHQQQQHHRLHEQQAARAGRSSPAPLRADAFEHLRGAPDAAAMPHVGAEPEQGAGGGAPASRAGREWGDGRPSDGEVLALQEQLQAQAQRLAGLQESAKKGKRPGGAEPSLPEAGLESPRLNERWAPELPDPSEVGSAPRDPPATAAAPALLPGSERSCPLVGCIPAVEADWASTASRGLDRQLDRQPWLQASPGAQRAPAARPPLPCLSDDGLSSVAGDSVSVRAASAAAASAAAASERGRRASRSPRSSSGSAGRSSSASRSRSPAARWLFAAAGSLLGRGGAAAGGARARGCERRGQAREAARKGAGPAAEADRFARPAEMR
jgi:hypothetical protein